MDILVLLIGLACVGVAFGLFARSLLLSRLRAAEALRHIDDYGYRAPGRAAAAGTPARRVSLPRLRPREALDRLASAAGGMVTSRVRSLSEDALRLQLMAAGFYTTPPRRFVGYQLIATIALEALWIRTAVTSDINPVLGLMGAVAALLLGWSAPLVYVKRRARLRGERIDYEMPDLIDMLVTTVEAGVAFSASLQIASRRFKGPLGQELRLTMQEQSMGLALDEALANMATRQGTPGVRSFVRALAQGEQLGVSVGQTLRSISQEMRTRRRQLAEKKAHEAPVKLVIPLVLFIFPSLLTVILGPAALRIHEVFG